MADDSSIVDIATARAELRAYWRRIRSNDSDPFAPERRPTPFSSFELGVEDATELGVVTTSDPHGRVLPLGLLDDPDEQPDR